MYPFEIFLAISSGVSLAISIIFLLIGFGIKVKNKTHIYFAFMSFLFAILFLNSILLFDYYSSKLEKEFIQVSKFGLLIFYLALVSQFLFIKEYTETKTNNFFYLIIFGYILIAFSNILFPLPWIYSSVTLNENGVKITPSPWYIIEGLFTIILYASYISYYTIHHYKMGMKFQSLLLGLAEIAFLISYISDFILIQLNIVPSFVIANFGFLIFIGLISLFQAYNIKHSEQELEKTTFIVSEITKQTGEGITVADPDGSYIFTNQAFCEMTGYTEQEILNMTIYDVMTPDEKPELFKKVRARKSGVREIELVRKDGSRFLSEISGFPVFLGNKNVILGVVRDITKKRELEIKLEESAKMEAMGKLAGGIAHDFNNILTGIMGYTKIATLSLDQQEEQLQYLDQITKACERGKKLIHQILIFSKKDKESEKSINIVPVINESMDFLKASLPSTIQIITNYEVKSSIILIDPIRLHEIIINLVTNAADAIKDKGIIEVSVSEQTVEEPIIGRRDMINPGRYAIISVSDNGCGMDEEIIGNLFQPFYTTKEKGTGMGLTVVYGIVKHSNGEIIVYSEVNKGSTFKIYFPISNLTIEPELSKNYKLLTGTESIMFIDDEEIVLDSLTDILRKLGYTVNSFLDPTKAVNFFKEKSNKIDIIITDQTMPSISGFELSQEFLKIRPDIKIILITGFSKNLKRRQVLNSGVSMVLMKPFNIEELATKLRELLHEIHL